MNQPTPEPRRLTPETAEFVINGMDALRRASDVIIQVRESIRSIEGFRTAEEQLDESIASITEATEEMERQLTAWESREKPIPRHERDRVVMNSSPGEYPWDHWETRAKARGISNDLSALGRNLMREAYQHDWPETLCRQAGWQDAGLAMIELATNDPTIAEARWRALLESDGGR